MSTSKSGACDARGLAGWPLCRSKAYKWEKDKVIAFLDAAGESFRQSTRLRLRTRIPQAYECEMIPGGEAMIGELPNGHGSLKIKAEALDEVVLRLG